MKTRRQIKKKISQIKGELLSLGLANLAYKENWDNKVKELKGWQKQLKEKDLHKRGKK